MDILISKTLPEVNHIAYVSHAHRVLLSHSFADSRNEFVEIIVEFIDPTLFVTLFSSEWIYFSHDAYHASDVSSFRLSA